MQLYRIPGLILAASLVLGTTACDQRQASQQTRIVTPDATIDLTLVDVTLAQRTRLESQVRADFDYMRYAWSRADSTGLGRVNKLLAVGEPFAAPPAVIELLKIARPLAERSGNLFNPANGGLQRLWGFDNHPPHCSRRPLDAELGYLVTSQPTLDDLEIDGVTLRTHNPELRLNFRDIALGYGIDTIAGRMRELGIENAFIRAGTNVRVMGSQQGAPWRVPLRGPSGAGVIGFVEISGDASVFTSTMSSETLECEGKSIHAILDPRTGLPAKGVRLVTVIHSDATTADAATTALFVAGPRNWHDVAERLGVRYVLLVDSEGVVHMNPAMSKRVELLAKDLTVRISQPLAGSS